MANRGPYWSRLDPDPSHPSNVRWKHFFEVFRGREPMPVEFVSEHDGTMDEGEMKLRYLETYLRVVVSRTAGRSFIITSQGYFGLAPLGARPGDVVCVMEGGAVPFVLRETPRSELAEYDIQPKEKQFHHVLVGESYVHGVSDGEWIRKGTQENVIEVILL